MIQEMLGNQGDLDVNNKVYNAFSTMKKQKLIMWLKDYANNNKCHVCVNSDYIPCVIAIWGNPTRRYDKEDGYWYWTYHGKGKFKWLDDEIPEELKMVRFELMEGKGTIFNPEKKMKNCGR